MSFTKKCFLTVVLERKSGITGVPFGRTELSTCGKWSKWYRNLRSFTLGWSRGPWFSRDARKVFFRVFVSSFFLAVFLERKRCITGVPFGRTELSICGNCT